MVTPQDKILPRDRGRRFWFGAVAPSLWDQLQPSPDLLLKQELPPYLQTEEFAEGWWNGVPYLTLCNLPTSEDLVVVWKRLKTAELADG